MTRAVVCGAVLLATVAVNAQTKMPGLDQPSTSQQPSVSSAQVRDYGTFRLKITGKVPAPDSPSGEANKVVGASKLKQTDVIPAVPGVSFGFRFSVAGKPNGAQAPLRIVTIFPAPGMNNPDHKGTIDKYAVNPQCPVGRVCYWGWTFDRSYELLPGTWTFQVWWGHALFFTQSFEVVSADV